MAVTPDPGEIYVLSGNVRTVTICRPGCGCNLKTPDPEATMVQLGCVTGYLVRCPTCTGPVRETVGLVCRTCGTDYGNTDSGSNPAGGAS